MKYKGYVYMIKNKVNGKIYIGQTYNKKGYKQRWNYHKWALKHNEHENKNLQNDYNVFGLEAFEFTLLHEFQANTLENLINSLDKMEKFYINSWNLLDKNFGYNVTDGGSSGFLFVGGNDKILCIETGQTFKTSSDVIDIMFNGKGLSNYIRANICGQRKSAYGYHFKYIE